MPGPVVKNSDWRSLTVVGKLEIMLGRTLDEIKEILDYPLKSALDQRDGVILNTKLSTHRAIMTTCTKLGIEQSRAMRQHDEELDRLTTQLRSRLKK